MMVGQNTDGDKTNSQQGAKLALMPLQMHGVDFQMASETVSEYTSPARKPLQRAEVALA